MLTAAPLLFDALLLHSADEFVVSSLIVAPRAMVRINGSAASASVTAARPATAIPRLALWSRRTTCAVTIAAGQLTDPVLGRALVDGDPFTLSAVAVSDDAPATVLAGPLAMAWSAVTNQWAAVLPYSGALDVVGRVRVIVTLTAGSTTHDLMDAALSFVRADGR
jgi:hypothetical protein